MYKNLAPGAKATDFIGAGVPYMALASEGTLTS